MSAIQKAEEESKGDRLADNYTKDKLNLDQMLLFNFVFDEDNPVLMSGCQKITKDVVRVFSRYYSNIKTSAQNMLSDLQLQHFEQVKNHVSYGFYLIPIVYFFYKGR